MERLLAQLFTVCIFSSKIGSGAASSAGFLAKASGSGSVDCAAACSAVNPAHTCFFDETCPGLGCNAMGRPKCRYCGFGNYIGTTCPGDLPPPPGEPWEPPEVEQPAWCSPVGVYECDKVCFGDESRVEVNDISKVEGTTSFKIHVTAEGGFQEIQQCSHLAGIGSLNILACATSARQGQHLRSSQFLQKLQFGPECRSFEKNIWRMYPLPVKTCSTSCQRKP
mmetsp:Transcript_63552/g.113081  ORF Transcript_63552/g.113081 Transcript_63552/m.113081 type:complete len:223 (+) Transcript_63552:43-711(+)